NEAKAKWDAIRGTPEGLKKAENGQPVQRAFRVKFEEAQAKLNNLSDPASKGLVAHGVLDAEKVGDTQLRVRGEAEKLGPVVPRGFLTAFNVPNAAPINTQQSGRLELANWLTSDANPLTARVYVNRVWSKLFGRGLVSTVDNFGVTGDAPSHPELLDYLAQTTIKDGWSLKRLVRQLVLTRTYQLSSQATEEHLARDPGNRLLWRHAPRRLTAEEIRDSLLLASGSLDRSRPTGTPAKDFRMVEMPDNGGQARQLHEFSNGSKIRSVYLPQLRGVTPSTLLPFDPVEQTLVSGNREVTTVPGQALFLLNSPFVRRQALDLAKRLQSLDGDDRARIETAYQLVLARKPTTAEVARAEAFIAEYAAAIPPDDASLAKADASENATPPTPAPASDAAATAAAGANANPDEADQSGVKIREDQVKPDSPRTAAWMAWSQALFAGAEFRYIR
ncbi:MAG TPA: DUF1553 domain-containing protein, partial [Pirellulaceae bacterium]|nr:DUF1553 domain-containing protein [Pirellulaceae bacterium]